jgi:hypothetical protein
MHTNTRQVSNSSPLARIEMRACFMRPDWRRRANQSGARRSFRRRSSRAAFECAPPRLVSFDVCQFSLDCPCVCERAGPARRLSGNGARAWASGRIAPLARSPSPANASSSHLSRGQASSGAAGLRRRQIAAERAGCSSPERHPLIRAGLKRRPDAACTRAHTPAVVDETR